tara:strand:- start:5745 stop:6053 length:309 start_codon:yes stop_codon:yes gene_type:complete
MQSSILKNPEEFEKLKEMLIQDAESSNMNAGFFDEEPEDYPCLVKIRELNHHVLDLQVDETDGETEQNNIEEMINDGLEEMSGYYYEFHFLTQKEIKQLLET